MNIVLLTHPPFLDSQSMPRFANMLKSGMEQRGHTVATWTAKPYFYKLPLPGSFKKWLGYIDQYIVFPVQIRRQLKITAKNTLFVFVDQALGPWVPLVAHLPHVVHCHDFLAQKSALGEIKENRTGWPGRQYQRYIRHGYSRGKAFISVSLKTREDLHRFLPIKPVLSKVVYNGLNGVFIPQDPASAKEWLGQQTGIPLSRGYLLHVGGNEWYKNRKGVIEIYNAWRSAGSRQLPLLLIGSAPSAELLKQQSDSPFQADIHFLAGINNDMVKLAYSGATLLLYPSLAEGFGWPVAEAMACGCPVVTTDEAPMSEVAGTAGFLIPRRPDNEGQVTSWAQQSTGVIDKVVNFSPSERQAVVEAGYRNAKRFDTQACLDNFEQLYLQIGTAPLVSKKNQSL